MLDFPGVTPEEIKAEYRRVIDLLAPHGSYVIYPIGLTFDFVPYFLEEHFSYGMGFYANEANRQASSGGAAKRRTCAAVCSVLQQPVYLCSAPGMQHLCKQDVTHDSGGGLVGCEAAADYIDRGIETTIVEMKGCLMPELTGLYRTAVHDYIDRNGGKYEVNARVVRVGKDYVVADQNGKEITLHADSVVNAMGRRAHNTDDLKKAVSVPLWEIGDCVRARQIGDSVREGWTAAMEII